MPASNNSVYHFFLNNYRKMNDIIDKSLSPEGEQLHKQYRISVFHYMDTPQHLLRNRDVEFIQIVNSTTRPITYDLQSRFYTQENFWDTSACQVSNAAPIITTTEPVDNTLETTHIVRVDSFARMLDCNGFGVLFRYFSIPELQQIQDIPTGYATLQIILGQKYNDLAQKDFTAPEKQIAVTEFIRENAFHLNMFIDNCLDKNILRPMPILPVDLLENIPRYQ